MGSWLDAAAMCATVNPDLSCFGRAQRAWPQRAQGKGTENHEFQDIFRVFQGIFRVFSLRPFRLCPLDPSKPKFSRDCPEISGGILFM